MPAWIYFSKATNMAMHDLTSYIKPPSNLKSLLGLNLKFIPKKKYSTYDLTESIQRFTQQIYIRDYYLRNPPVSGPDDSEPFNKKLHIPTHWMPPTWQIAKDVVDKTEKFTSSLQQLFRKRRSYSNLSVSQQNLLQKLMSKKDFVIAKADKNLGPCIIEKDAYIRFAIQDHLRCKQTYNKLSYNLAISHMADVRKKINKFLYKHRKTLTPIEKKFIRKRTKDVADDPFPVLYLLMKVHKTPLKTRPVVSCSGSLLHGLGIWLDTALQPIATSLPSFIGSSYDLKEALDSMPPLPPNSQLFTADAVSMYTNIDTYRAIGSIRSFLNSTEDYKHLPLDAINDALELIMYNNVFRFGDCYFHQLSGTAMGTPPACCYATIYYAVKEKTLLHKYKENLVFYKRYIDDVFGIWVNNNPTLSFDMFSNDLKYHKLEWTVNPLANSAIFLDMELTITDQTVSTKLYEKILNLYLYISPYSAHPPGVLSGLVIGNILRIYHLCSEPSQRTTYYKMFFQRLRARGYLPSQLNNLFQRAFILAKTKPMPSTKNKRLERENIRNTNVNNNTSKTEDNSAILHIPFHPKSPNSKQIQQLFRTTFLGKDSSVAGLDKLIVANSRPRNLGEILSYRRIESFDGPSVSSYNFD